MGGKGGLKGSHVKIHKVRRDKAPLRQSLARGSRQTSYSKIRLSETWAYGTALVRLSKLPVALIPIEGRVLDFDTAEAVYAQLAGAQRELKKLAVAVAVMERRARA